MEEDVYTDQNDALEKFRGCLYRMAWKDAGKEIDVIKVPRILQAVRQVFPGKREDMLYKLQRALEKDFESEVRIGLLFEEDRDGNQCAFIEMLRSQQVDEREEYLKAIEVRCHVLCTNTYRIH